jgi:predicted amidophosphoribosyltransferase
MSEAADASADRCNGCDQPSPHYNLCSGCERRIAMLRARCKQAVRELDDIRGFVFEDLIDRDRRLLRYFEPPQLIREVLEEGSR